MTCNCGRPALDEIKLCEECLHEAVINSQQNFGLDQETLELLGELRALHGLVVKG